MWETVKLGEIANISIGKTPPRGDKRYWDKDKDTKNVWLSIADMNSVVDGFVSESKEYISDAGAALFKPVPAHTLIMSFKLSIGKLAFTACELRTNEAIAALEIKNENQITKEYLRHFLSSRNWDKIAGDDEKVKGKTLNKAKLKELEIILPPLAEQHRIVAKLDAAFAEIDNIATITEKKLKEARKLYASGITEIYFSDKSVPVVPLSTISKIKGGKRLPKGKKLQIEPTSYPYIRVSDFTNFGTIDEKSVQYITEEIRGEISRYTISSEDVYVSIAGTIGKTGVIPQSLDGANLTENAAKIVLNEECDKNYFYFFTTSSSFEKQAIAQTRTAAQPKLALERLGAVELPIHNRLTQQAIAEKARDLRDSVKLVETLLNEKLLKTQALKSAILAQELQSEAA